MKTYKKSVDGTVGLHIENHLLNYKTYMDFKVSCIYMDFCLPSTLQILMYLSKFILKKVYYHVKSSKFIVI